MRLLDDLLDKTLSLNEAESESCNLKITKTTEDTFLKEVECKTWEEAKELIPSFAKREKLMKFKGKGKGMSSAFTVSNTCMRVGL